MTLEVEQKFAVGNFAPIRQQLDSLGAQWLKPTLQRDTYFAHPQRNFATTDEALRLRHTVAGLSLTYKGPRTDSALKTRREIEVALPADAKTADGITEVLSALGFHPVAEVHKQRTEALLTLQGQCIHVALDDVDSLGPFVEIEMIVPEEGSESAAKLVGSLANTLQLHHVESRSYLEMWLQTRSA